jgi:hypothetical protein
MSVRWKFRKIDPIPNKFGCQPPYKIHRRKITRKKGSVRGLEDWRSKMVASSAYKMEEIEKKLVKLSCAGM